MLMQNFRTAADLGITDVEQAALVSVLYMLERQEVVTHALARGNQNSLFMFDYLYEDAPGECGTVACLCGWAHKLSHKQAFPELAGDKHRITDTLAARLPQATQDLFWINTEFCSENPTIDQAAAALRRYLTTGHANWGAALT